MVLREKWPDTFVVEDMRAWSTCQLFRLREDPNLRNEERLTDCHGKETDTTIRDVRLGLLRTAVDRAIGRLGRGAQTTSQRFQLLQSVGAGRQPQRSNIGSKLT